MEEEIISLPRLKFSKTIIDPVHGCIQLTQLEYQILQLPSLNRLHNVHQLGLAYLVYPAGKTSRFEHSLGVMNIASKMVYQILESATREELKDIFNINPDPENFMKDCSLLIQKVRLAALLHDIGHGPFSHATESFLRKTLKDEEIEEAKLLFNCEKSEDIPAHEYFTYKMITDENSSIRKILESSEIKNAEEIANLLVKKETNREDVRILRKIISSQLDADRMDNLLRDSHATGVPFGLSDIDRVIHNLFITKYKGRYELVVHERALRGVEDIIDARFKMNKSVYTHHLVSALEELLRETIDSMIKKGQIKLEDFRPEKFLDGETDDVFIYFKLREFQKNDSRFKAFFDRNYAPISLIKRENDFDDLRRLVSTKLNTSNLDVIERNIGDWFDKIKKKEREIKLPEELKNIVLLFTVKYISPYEPLKEESILIYQKGSIPIDLLDYSPYIKAINEEIENFPTFRIAFLLPGVQKSSVKKYKEKVLNLIAEDIAKFATGL